MSDANLPVDFTIAFLASDGERAQKALAILSERYDHVDADTADVVVALGGDGFMLQVQHRFMGQNKPIFGLNLGTVGFLMNTYNPDNLRERLAQAKFHPINPLKMIATNEMGETFTAHAINEVSLFRETRQAAKIEILLDGKKRLETLMCDGVMLATPAGSTAYNLSVNGPIIPFNSQILALTPISAFRPRRWRGALVPKTSKVTFNIREREKRPTSAVADNYEVRNVISVDVYEDLETTYTILSDPDWDLDERILKEQFEDLNF